MAKHVVGPAADVPPGSRKLYTVKGRPVAVFNLDGEYFGLFDKCPHQGGSLCAGAVTGLVRSDVPGQYEYSKDGEIVRCPWHGWEFDIRTGQSWCEPERVKVKTYQVDVMRSDADAPGGPGPAGKVPGPYVAETIPVMVEDEFIVVTL